MTVRALTLASWLLGAGLLTVAGAVPSVAFAQNAAKEAEKFRLIEEMNKLAGKNAWAGVERSYIALQALKVDLPFETHYLGAQSARYLGKTWEVHQRLEAARALEAKEEIVQSLAGIEATYGRVKIEGDIRRPAALARPDMPFAPDERKSVEWAQEVMANTGSFEGMLPAGSYKIGECVDLEVQAGSDWQVVPVPKKCGEKGETIVYTGPVLIVGPSFVSSGAPASTPDGEAISVAHPDDVAGGGVLLGGGYEIGFSQMLGVAATASYSNVLLSMGAENTNISMHQVSGWLALVARPGLARIAVGPTYGFLSARGTGVADYVYGDELDTNQYPRETLRYRGSALLGGAQFSAGYGILDWDPLLGVVELGATWQTDGLRSYTGFGIRVGIAPKVPRFEG